MDCKILFAAAVHNINLVEKYDNKSGRINLSKEH